MTTREDKPSGKSYYTTWRGLSQDEREHLTMESKELVFEIEEIGLEMDTIESLLNVFEKWFDKGFQTSSLERTQNKNEAADLWAESPDYATVFDTAMEKLCALRRLLKELDKENSAV